MTAGDVDASTRALLDAWHAPAIGHVTSATDPRAHPSDGRIAVTGGVLASPLGPATSRVQVVGRDGSMADPWSFEGATRAPRWSPDGSQLAFTSDREQRGIHQLVVADADDLSVTCDGPSVPGTIEHLAWSPLGDGLLAVVAGYGAEQAGAMASGRVPVRPQDQHAGAAPVVTRFDGVAPEGEWRRLWHLAPGRVGRCLTPDGPCVWEAAWAGPAAVVAVVSDRPEEDAWYGARLALLDVVTGDERVLVTSDRQLGVPAGSPDGRWAACIEAPCSDRTLVAGRLVLVDLTSSTVERLTLDLDVTHLTWLDGGRLLVSGLVGMDTRIVEIDVATRGTTLRWATDACVGPRQPEAWPSREGGIVVAAEAWHEPPQLLEIGRDGGTPIVRWTGRHAGTEVMVAAVPPVRRITWTAPDGWEIDGLLVCPPGEGPFPTVLYAHGGPVAMWRRRFLGGYVVVPLLLQRGFAVFMPNPRGSSGYGWDFADAVHGDMGGRDTHDLLSGIDRLVADGVADPRRLSVMGGSYAGYMTCWLVTQTDRFRAAVASAPVTNWVSEHYQSNIPQWGMRFLPDTDRFPHGGHVSRSPVFLADRVRTPTFLTAGAHDRCCPPTQCVEFHEALRQHGVPTEMAIYPHEAHNVPTGENLVDFVTRSVEWIETWCR